jgi:hypothetical protein
MTITQTKTPRLSRGDRLKLKTNTVLARMRRANV